MNVGWTFPSTKEKIAKWNLNAKMENVSVMAVSFVTNMYNLNYSSEIFNMVYSGTVNYAFWCSIIYVCSNHTNFSEICFHILYLEGIFMFQGEIIVYILLSFFFLKTLTTFLAVKRKNAQLGKKNTKISHCFGRKSFWKDPNSSHFAKLVLPHLFIFLSTD